MKRLHAVLLLLLAFTLFGAAPSSAQTCTPHGVVPTGYGPFYDHIANGEPASTSCWAPVNVTFVSGLPACSIGGPTYKAFQFNYASSATQQFTIPASMTGQSFGLTFNFDFIDPNHDPFNSLGAELRDLTTGTVLGWFDYFGGMPDTNVKCRRVDLAFNGNLTGHTIQVRFTGQKGYANTFIRIHSITFFQGL